MGGRARAFLTSDVIEEDLRDEWCKPYPNVKPRVSVQPVWLDAPPQVHC